MAGSLLITSLAAREVTLGANGTGGASTVLAQVLNNNFNHKCNSYSNPCFQTAGIFNGQGLTVDPDSGNVVPVGPGPSPQTNYGNVPRNAFYGPHYADVDLNLYKDVYKHESIAFQIGAQAYNAFNHVNLGQPDSCVDCQDGNAGTISSTLASQDGTTMRRLQFSGRFSF